MRILHTMLRVGDLDRSVAFYTNVLGMKLLRKTDRPEQKYTLAFVTTVTPENWVGSEDMIGPGCQPHPRNASAA